MARGLEFVKHSLIFVVKSSIVKRLWEAGPQIWGKACRHFEIVKYSLILVAFSLTAFKLQIKLPQLFNILREMLSHIIHILCYCLQALQNPDIDYQSMTCDQSVCSSDSSLMWVMNLHSE